MAVVVAKLEGEDIPEHLRGEQVNQVFRITNEEGESHYLTDDEEAARLAVKLSEPTSDIGDEADQAQH